VTKNPALLAASIGQTEVLSLLQELGLDITLETSNSFGARPIFLAAMGGHVDAVQFLVERGNASLVDELTNNTIAHVACDYGQLDVLEYVLRDKTLVLRREIKTGRLPLHRCAATGRRAMLRMLAHAAPQQSWQDHKDAFGLRVADLGCLFAKSTGQASSKCDFAAWLSSNSAADPQAVARTDSQAKKAYANRRAQADQKRKATQSEL
jgi:ankyrin repeat protein